MNNFYFKTRRQHETENFSRDFPGQLWLSLGHIPPSQGNLLYPATASAQCLGSQSLLYLPTSF